MEKIEGLDLYQYMEQRGNRPIDEKLALLWLTQLANILYEVHQQNFFHRDIKPPNIMLKADGHLALIDFGTAREVTRTYHQKAAGQNITGIISLGYTPLEQANGKAVPQSDFFALGRTFVYLLTGKSPDQFSEGPRTGRLMWRDSALQVSKQVAGLIDYLMEAFPGKRPQNAQMILRCLSEINSTVQSYSTSSSASQLPPTEIEKPKQSRQIKTSATTQIQSSKTEPDIFSSKTAQFTGGVIAFAILFLIKFGSWVIHKPFQSHPSQPVVTSTPTELQANNSEPANTDSTNQQPPISEENIPSGVPSGWKKFEGGGAELWLPPNWKTIELSQISNKNFGYSRSLDPNMEKFFIYFKQLLSTASIFSVNPPSDQWAIVFKEQIPANNTLKTYLQETNKAFSNSNQSLFRIVDIQIGQNDKYERGRIILKINNALTEVVYLIKDRHTLWSVGFICKSNDFQDDLSIFETSFYTFSFNQ